MQFCVSAWLLVRATGTIRIRFPAPHLENVQMSPEVAAWRRTLGSPTPTTGLSISEYRQDTWSILFPPAEQETCNRPLTPDHFESLSPSLRAGANPCCVYHTTGTTAGWSVCSLSWTSWWADAHGCSPGWCVLICISTNRLQGGISAHTVSYGHLKRYEGLSPVWCSKSPHSHWQISLFNWKIVLVRD